LPARSAVAVRALRVSPEPPVGLRPAGEVLVRLHRRRPRVAVVGRLGADGPGLAEEVTVVEAGRAADRVEEELPVHLDQLRIADVATARKVVRVHLADERERLSLVARLEHLDARPLRSDLARLAAAEDEQDAAPEPDHLGVLAVEAVRVD